MRNRLLCLTACLLLAALCTTAFAAPPRYDMTILDFPSADYEQCRISGINSYGQVIGYGLNRSDWQWHGFLWENGTRTEIVSSTRDSDMPHGINNRGEVLVSRNLLYKDGVYTVGCGTEQVGYSMDVDDYGTVVGQAFDGRDTPSYWPQSPFIYGHASGTQLLTDPDYLNGIAEAISDTAGYVCGWYSAGESIGYAFLRKDGVTTRLSIPYWCASSACDVNDSGWVIGSVDGYATLWRGAERINLGSLEGDEQRSVAYAINNLGQIVGQTNTPTYDTHGFVWQDGVMYDVNDYIPGGLAWHMYHAQAINDRGQIAGIGGYEYTVAGILLTPVVPEPSSLLALAGGLAAIGGMIRRRK